MRCFFKSTKTQYHGLYRFPFVVAEYSTKDVMCGLSLLVGAKMKEPVEVYRDN